MTICEIDLRVGGAWRYVMVPTGGFEVAQIDLQEQVAISLR